MNPSRAPSVYRSGGGDARRLFGRDARKAARYYHRYLRFVSSHSPRGGRLVDLGCGSGWSSWLLARRGYHVTGLDMDPRAFEPPPGSRLRFTGASVRNLPFRDAAFDVVASFQVLEHVGEPEAALAEMARVTKAGGIVIVAGPNLLSPLNSLRQIVLGCWRNRPLSTILIRREEDPHLPFGHTLPEALLALARNAGRLATRALLGGGRLPHRQPDLRPPSRGDRDACILLNPLDTAAFFRAQGWEILATSFPGRPRFTGWLAGGTWVAARKPQD